MRGARKTYLEMFEIWWKERKSYNGREERNFCLLPLSWNRDNILDTFSVNKNIHG